MTFVNVCVHRYENIVQIRALYEGVSVDDMLSSWEHLLPAKMAEWGLQRGDVRECVCLCVCGWVGR